MFYKIVYSEKENNTQRYVRNAALTSDKWRDNRLTRIRAVLILMYNNFIVLLIDVFWGRFQSEHSKRQTFQ